MSGRQQAGWLGDVLPRPYTGMMHHYFMRQADEIRRRHQPSLGREGWERRRRQLRLALIDALGGFPERTPLHATVTSVHRRPGYRVENVIFESRPQFYVTASVFIPDDLARPAPAVLCPHGHWRQGRYQDVVQGRCTGLARRGYVVLSLDAVGYNEREPMGHFRTWNLEAVGMTTQGVMVWDNMRAIDYLCGREDVDPERIGCTGASGGGNQTMYVSALDERIKASVPVCSAEMVVDYVQKDLCTCETFAGVVRLADLTEILGLLAPRALLMINGILDDGFPILAARMAAARLRDLYALHDPDRFAAFESYSEHDYNAEMRQAMYAWFDRWLMGRETQGDEEVLDKALLQAAPSGLPRGFRTMSDLFRERLAGLQPIPVQTAVAVPVQTAVALSHYRLTYPVPSDAEQWQARRAGLVAWVEEAMGGLAYGSSRSVPERTGLDVRLVATEQWHGHRLERLWFRSELDVIIPAVLLSPKGNGAHGVTVYYSTAGKASLPEAEALAILGRGEAVLAFDARGVGETAYDHHLAFIAGLGLGRTPVAMHAFDILRGLDYLETRTDVGRVSLVARGGLPAAMAALLAAGADRRIGALDLEALPATLRLPYEGEGLHFVWPTDELYLPHLLEHIDMPLLLALVAPRALRLGAVLDADLRPLPSTEARQALAQTLRAYQILGAADQVRLG